MYLMPLNCVLKMVRMVDFMLGVFYQDKRKKKETVKKKLMYLQTLQVVI